MKHQMKTRRVLVLKHTCVYIKITVTKTKISIWLFMSSTYYDTDRQPRSQGPLASSLEKVPWFRLVTWHPKSGC